MHLDTAMSRRLRLLLACLSLGLFGGGVALAIADDGSPYQTGASEIEPSDSTVEEKGVLEKSTFLPEKDEDPLTIEALSEEGAGYTLEIHGDPKVFEGISPEELAEKLYPCDTFECMTGN